jgi:hypothetical protein
MTIRRFVLIFIAGLALQATVFAIRYDDLIYLRRPAGEIASSSPEAFERYATSALDRQELTLTHLDTIAVAARSMRMPDLEVRALERYALGMPGDDGARLRLADALRRAGEYDRAETIYLAVLEATAGEVP